MPTSDLSIGAGPGLRPPRPPSLVDGQRRSVRYLRVSVTDRCNFRCVYCMPAEGVPFVPRRDVLTFEEIERLVRCFVRLGIRKVRLTGGEPLLRKDIVELVGRIAAVDGVEDLAMTTNGHLLTRLAGPLAQAGLERVNISIDTLRADRFARITRVGSLDRVLPAIDAAVAADLRPIKLNAVIVRGFNDDELGDMVRFAAERDLLLRFIEYMPIGTDGFWGDDTFYGTGEMIARLERDFELHDPDGHAAAAGVVGGGPAVYREVFDPRSGRRVKVGFISALSHNFCSTCNRVRLTATGTLQECLAYAGEVSLRDAMRGGADDDALQALVEDALFGKGPGHRFDDPDGPLRTPLPMSSIGG